jgi:hypothetical protein
MKQTAEELSDTLVSEDKLLAAGFVMFVEATRGRMKTMREYDIAYTAFMAGAQIHERLSGALLKPLREEIEAFNKAMMEGEHGKEKRKDAEGDARVQARPAAQRKQNGSKGQEPEAGDRDRHERSS